jgi:hypothetical protein
LKKFGVLSLATIILLGVSGCMETNNNPNNNSQGSNNQNINDVAIEYMENKYGEKFEYSAPYGNSMTGTHELLVTCESLSNQQILVQIENYRSEDKIFRDNYLAVKYHQQTVDFIHDCAVKHFGEAEVFYEATKDGLSTELSANASFNEYLADTRVPLNFSIGTKASLFTSEEQAEKLAEALAVYGTRYIAVLASVADEDYGKSGEDDSMNFVKRVQLTKLDENIEIDWLKKG